MDVVMTTYFPPDVPERKAYAIRCIAALAANLRCDREPLRLVVSDDSEQFDTSILAACAWPDSIYCNTSHRGIGASLNNSLREVGPDGAWMYVTDDWLLAEQLWLDEPMKLLTERGYDLVRLGPVHPDLACVTRFDETIGWWLDLRQEYGGFAFATRPFIATKAFYDKVGPFDEGLDSYETEILYAAKVATSTAKLAYWGGIDLAGPWEHIGLENVGYRSVG